MTPRRSSRARTSQPSPALLQHTNSSSSANSMTRERSTRSNHKISSPHRSQSVEEPDATSKTDYPQTRQRRTRGDGDNDRLGEEDGEDDEDEEEEEEVTRCLCGQQEYPGLPPSRREALGRNGIPPKVKDESAINLSTESSDLMPDDIGSMFIQCDSCKVWQHGGCVGIMDEAMSPDEYFCEECRKDLHRIRSEPNGQHSSQYLPVAPPSTSSSRASSRSDSKRGKDPKARPSEPPKRRSTMNSRDAAYDEEELIRRAIEESKEETLPGEEEIAIRRGKRSRSDSEAHKQATKRQRTSSPSPGATPKPSNPPSQAVSEDESKAKPPTNGVRRPRAASRTQRDKEPKELEEPEAEPEGNRRKGKTEVRKGESGDSDHETEPLSKPVVTNESETSQPIPDAPAPVQEPAPRPSTRKSGRPPARRGGGRVGRNQYTRDRDTNGGDSPRRGQSHDTGGDSPRVGGPNGTHINGGESGKPSRPRYVNQRSTMNEMKRRVAGILEFISRMQVEMAVAGESTSPPNNGERLNGIAMKAVSELLEIAAPSTTSEADSGTTATDGEMGILQQQTTEKDFKDLSSVEMMDVLTRHLLKWQQEYGKFGER
ncbi:hypothetical protein FE257_004738 [Aspergillus nanangensis]|uniref:Zinc finger PHD-type domain-containing protein n=1 Tax=Aspergillus nanangensis TaxID=2582783 RepID=A0AAD4CR56_ASPNN|nr:hypothetical protein FE257_004738 [Aspergillus nanangensis]